MPFFGFVNNLIQGGKQKKLAKSIKPVNATYTESPFIEDLYSEGRNLYQGRMAGANAAEQAIATNAANTNANIGRNAGDASTLLATAAGVQGQADDATINLATQEGQNKVGRFGVYSNVSQLMNAERDKVFQDKLRKYYDDLNYKRALEGASMQNKANAWGGLDNMIMSAASLFTPGGALAGAGRSAGSAVGAAASDIRLKENYYVVGKSASGINIYEFSYKGNAKRFVGVMAQEVMWATKEVNGYLYVDYSLTDVQFKEV